MVEEGLKVNKPSACADWLPCSCPNNASRAVARDGDGPGPATVLDARAMLELNPWMPRFKCRPLAFEWMHSVICPTSSRSKESRPPSFPTYRHCLIPDEVSHAR